MTVTPLARRTDRETSKVAGRLAAANADLIESWVLTQFHKVGAAGLTDLDLKKRYVKALSATRGRKPAEGDWETPRKRRSGLTRQGLIIATNRTRKGVRSQQTVWAHRDYLTPSGSAA